MKRKLLVLSLSLLIGISLTGCKYATQEDVKTVEDKVSEINGYDDQEIKDQVFAIESTLATLELQGYDDEDVQAKITLLQDSITNLLAAIATINTTLGDSQETDILVQINTIEANLLTLTSDLLIAQNAIDELQEEGTSSSGSELVKNIDYIFDDNGDYVKGLDLMNMLIFKYFGIFLENPEYCENVCLNVSSDIMFDYNTSEVIDLVETFAKYILMLEELRTYEFYYENRDGIMMSLSNDLGMDVWTNFSIQVPTTTLLHSDFNISVHEIFNSMYDVRFYSHNITITENDIQDAYDKLVDEGTFSGYVLDIE